MKSLFVFIIVFLIPLCAYADWITKGTYSEKAGIDSLERLLVINDTQDNTYLGYGIIPLGDINDDGKDDIILCRTDFSVLTKDSSFLYYGGNPPEGNSDGAFENFTQLTFNIGDINGDGYDDLAESDGYTAEVSIYYGGPLLDDTPDFTFAGVWTSFIPKAADIDNDGVLDLVLTENLNGGNVYIYKLGPNIDDISEYTIIPIDPSYGRRAALLDFNGDGYADIACAHMNSRDDIFSVLLYWGGPDFDTTPDFEIPGNADLFGNLTRPAGDFNGDGYDDLIIMGLANARFGVYFGGPYYDAQLDVPLNYRGSTSYFVPTTVDIAGDVNNDSYNDIIVGYMLDGLTGWFYLHLGGPDVDSIADVVLSDFDFLPESVNGYGECLAGIGDFNGDGLDDFAARSQTDVQVLWQSMVHIFSGWDNTPVDVPYDYEPTMPSSFKLSQNYPNPFNPTTNISFDISYRSHVALTIHNILGQEVARLIDKELAAGSYNVRWNGTDNYGAPLGSGVYLYRLEADDAVYSKKMILMK